MQEISFIDSMPLKVCHNKRLSRHKFFRGLAGREKLQAEMEKDHTRHRSNSQVDQLSTHPIDTCIFYPPVESWKYSRQKLRSFDILERQSMHQFHTS